MVVCGLYRTHLILLALLFELGTSGIWMLVSSINNGGPIYVLLDCEGSGNVEHDREHDSTLFALATLLSGYFIYNSKGVIDEGAIQTLSVVTSLAQHIQQAQGDDDSSVQRSSITAPHFLWVLRDFVLSLEDQNSRPISAQEYLEIALSDKSSVAAYRSQESRDCREKLCKLFTHRDCIALVTPVVDEDQLQTLDTVPYNQLRQEFRDQVELLKRKVYRDCEPKRINGVPVTGVTFAKLLDQYASLGRYQKLALSGKRYRHRKERGRMMDDKVNSKLPISEVDLSADLKELRHEIYGKFKRCALGEKKVVMQYREQLKDIMDGVDKQVKSSNDKLANKECLRVLKALWRPIVDRLDAYDDDNNAYSIDDGITEFTRDLSHLREAYQKEARGPSTVVMDVYTKWMTPKQEQGLLKLTLRQQEAAAQRAVMAERERAIEEEKRRAEKELEERRAREKEEREKYREERTEKMRNDVKQLVVDIEGIDTPSSVEGTDDDGSQAMGDTGRMQVELIEVMEELYTDPHEQQQHQHDRPLA
ncbi:hypothetical protein FOL47_004805 [Perkinsus chesapeaki]|uniref:GB1/RHD3-type G domain-containing protein n=1 Tax=Perkinsus chesapeaki TaxID=330153 RepID=A0A7J6M0N1_PERCH|nr:hypothetical protein FOL47_004805 [Perkinsus chesapeaki]